MILHVAMNIFAFVHGLPIYKGSPVRLMVWTFTFLVMLITGIMKVAGIGVILAYVACYATSLPFNLERVIYSIFLVAAINDFKVFMIDLGGIL